MKFMEKAKRFFTLNAANHEGFTLVELIVVIAILAILAGVAVPAYSGYIKRAEKAGDLQLLAAVNDAFAAACMVDNKATTQISDAVLDWDGNKIVGLTSVSGADFDTVNNNFIMFWGSNKDAEFKVLGGKLFFANGVFGEMSEGVSKLMDKLLSDYGTSIDALKGSVFNEIGYSALAGQINNASDLLAGFYGHENSGFHALLNSDANYDVLNSFLPEDEDEADAVYQKIFDAKLAALQSDPRYVGMTPTQLENMAHGQIMSNTAILTAAQNKDAINNDFIAALGNGNAVSMLQGATDGGAASEDTIAQAAFAYAMYTSYQASQGVDVSGDVDIMDVYNVLGTQGFQNYMKNDSAADQAGYLGAMDLIAGSANNADSDLAQNILLNGFNSAELVALMQGVTK